MKRNICTLTDSSCMAQAMIRSSHQRRSKMLSPAPAEALEDVAADLLRGPFDLGQIAMREVVGVGSSARSHSQSDRPGSRQMAAAQRRRLPS